MEIDLAGLQQTYAGKSTEELLALHGRGTLTDVGYEALEAELRRRSVAVPARVLLAEELAAAEDRYQRMTLSAHWRGEAPLASAYWLIGTLGFWLTYGVFLIASQLARSLAAVAFVVLLVVIAFSWVSIWRCWKNSGWLGWGYIARALVVLNIITLGAVAVSVVYRVRGLP
jgi:hypothetical protein